MTPEGAAVDEAGALGVIADLHLGYDWARGRGGDMVIEHAWRETRGKLESLLARHQLSRLVVAGDMIESAAPCEATRRDVQAFEGWLAERGIGLVRLRGNHDPHSGPESFEHKGWTIAHGDRPIPQSLSRKSAWSVTGTDSGRLRPAPVPVPDRENGDRHLRGLRSQSPFSRSQSPSGTDFPFGRMIIGHHHPVVRAGGPVIPAFLVGAETIALPAFSLNAAGWDVTSRGVPPALKGRDLNVIVALDSELLDFGPAASLPERLRGPAGRVSWKRRSGRTASNRRTLG